LAEYQAATDEERQVVRDRVGHEFESAGAHFVIDTVADLPGVLLSIEHRLAKGLRP
jgi:phosphonoacetaldehyde hydrolase